MEQVLVHNTKQLMKLLSECARDTVNNIHFAGADAFSEPSTVMDAGVSPKPSFVRNEWESLSKRHMKYRKKVRFNTRKRAQAVTALEETLYKHYYLKLTKLTKMRESLDGPSYTSRSNARCNGIYLAHSISLGKIWPFLALS